MDHKFLLTFVKYCISFRRVIGINLAILKLAKDNILGVTKHEQKKNGTFV